MNSPSIGSRVHSPVPFRRTAVAGHTDRPPLVREVPVESTRWRCDDLVASPSGFIDSTDPELHTGRPGSLT